MYQFETVTNAPAASRFGGGRSRSNPFDEPVRQSYEENYEATDKWITFTVEPTKIKTVVGQIRAAGGHHKLGTEIRKDDETGQVWFRGTEKHDRGRRASQVNMGGSEPSYYDQFSHAQ